jgi:hypothetical protein
MTSCQDSYQTSSRLQSKQSPRNLPFSGSLLEFLRIQSPRLQDALSSSTLLHCSMDLKSLILHLPNHQPTALHSDAHQRSGGVPSNIWTGISPPTDNQCPIHQRVLLAKNALTFKLGIRSHRLLTDKLTSMTASEVDQGPRSYQWLLKSAHRFQVRVLQCIHRQLANRTTTEASTEGRVRPHPHPQRCF